MSSIDTLRDALFGSPPDPRKEPSREGLLAAFTEMQRDISAAANNLLRFETKALLDADITEPDGTLAYVYGDATATLNTVYQSTGGTWAEATWYFDAVAGVVQPMLDEMQQLADEAETAADTMERITAAVGRAAIYGVLDPPAAEQFAYNTFELDFTERYYRNGLERYADLREPDNITPIVPGFTFTRNSLAWHIVNGDRAQVSTNIMRISDAGFLIERQAFQSVGYSTDVENLPNTNASFADGPLDPYGITSTRVTAASTGATTLQINGTGTASGNGDTAWFLVKKGNGATIGNRFALNNSTTGQPLLNIGLNYDTGQITYYVGAKGARAVPLSNGWWRVELTPPSGVSANDGLRAFVGFVGLSATAGDNFLISHAQIESTGNATSPIVTTNGAAFDRKAEMARFTLPATGDFTLVAEAQFRDRIGRQVVASVDDGTSLNRLTVLRDATGAIVLELIDNGNASSFTIAARKAGERQCRIAMAAHEGSVRVSVDGGPASGPLLARPSGLNRVMLGQDFNGGHLDGEVRRIMVRNSAASDADLQKYAALQQPRALADAPLTAHPLQGRFNPNTSNTPTGPTGRQAVVVYGELPCSLLIAENRGISALLVNPDGSTVWRDTTHQGRWFDVDPLTGYSLIGAADLRTIRWVDRQWRVQHQWSLPGTVNGNIYGLRTNGVKMVVNTETGGGASGETWIFDLDANGVPTGAGTAFADFTGAGMIARSMLIDGSYLWIAKMTGTNPQGCVGQVQRHPLAGGPADQTYYGHYPNDLDKAPNGEIVWADEHLDRIRGVMPATGTVRTIMAGLEVCANYEPPVGHISSNVLARRVAGSIIEAAAVEYRGLPGLYAPNGVTVISQGLYAITDTDNSRVIVARETDTWEPEIVAVVGLLNEPTKARVLPA